MVGGYTQPAFLTQDSLQVRRQYSEQTASGSAEILSALRVAYQTNRLLRDLLALAGYKDPRDRSLPIEESVLLLKQLLLDRTGVDLPTYTLFSAKDGRPSVEALLTEAGSHLPCPFAEAFNCTRPVILEIAARCDEALRYYGSENYHENPQVLEPPQYIVMWDIRGSTDRDSRDEIEPSIAVANRRIAGTLGDRVRDFRPESRDDGNGLICSTFSDVLAVFLVLSEVYHATPFRAGCEVNLQGRLNYYPASKALGGRAFEHAARVAALFKEIAANPCLWSESDAPDEPPTTYLAVGEFASRYAAKEGLWPPQTCQVHELPGKYEPRVRGAIPIAITLVKPANTA